MKLWALSFHVGPAVIVLECETFGMALRKVRKMEGFPGGPCMGRQVPRGAVVEPEDRNRFIRGEEIWRVFPAAGLRFGPPENFEIKEDDVQ